MEINFMKRALELADIAKGINEVPVGAVVVNRYNEIIGEGFNKNITDSDPCSHAEINALQQAANSVNNHRLIGCDLYVTLEPCMMCLGAIIHARINTVYFGARDSKTGCLGGIFDLNSSSYGWNHQVKVVSGLLEDECSNKLKFFFKELRASKKS